MSTSLQFDVDFATSVKLTQHQTFSHYFVVKRGCLFQVNIKNEPREIDIVKFRVQVDIREREVYQACVKSIMLGKRI